MGKRYTGGGKASTWHDIFSKDLPMQMIAPRLTALEEQYPDKLLRKEYSRLRDIGQKRLKRMEGKEEAAGTYEQHAGGFPKLSEIHDRGELVQNLMDLSNFLTAKTGSLSGIRERNKDIQETLKEHGVEIPKDQLANFGRFMNALKKALNIKDKSYDSKQLRDVWDEMFRKGKISKKKFKEAVDAVISDLADKDKLTKKEMRKARNFDPSSFFDEEQLDPRTKAAKRRQEKRKAENRKYGRMRRK